MGDNVCKKHSLEIGIVTMILAILFLSSSASALSNSGGGIWQFSRDITLSNSGSPLTDFQVQVHLTGSDFPLNAQIDGNDIRFTDNIGNELNYWISGWDYSGMEARITVNVSGIPAGTSTIRMFYGNPSASSSSNGEAAFIFFDTFSGTSLDTSKWDQQASGTGTTIVGGDQIQFTSSSSSDYVWIHSLTQFNYPVRVEAQVDVSGIGTSALRMGESAGILLKANGNYNDSYSTDVYSGNQRIVGDSSSSGFVVNSTPIVGGGLWSFVWAETGSQSLDIDLEKNVLIGSNSINTIGNYYFYLGLAKSGPGTASVSNARVRKYAPSDPTTVVGAEQNMPSTVYVDTTYADGSAGGHFYGYDAFNTLKVGIDAVAPGGIVNVASGTYNENQIVINKAISVQGSGSSTTIIDGSSATLTTDPGLIRITATTGDVTFSGFTVQNAGANPAYVGNSGMPVRVSIYASSSNAIATFTISNNKIIGSDDPLDEEDYGFYSNGGLENLVFNNNEITKTGSNAILLEKHYGATDVSYNTWDRGVPDGTVDPYFNMNYGGTDITSLQKVSHNTIDMGTGTTFDNAHRGFAISFASSFTGDATAGGFTNVQVTDNTISNLKAYRRGIGFWNNAPGDGSTGNINAPIVSGNTITGTSIETASIGIRLLGLVTGASITNNDVNNVDISFRGQEWNTHIATGTILNSNSFTSSTTGLDWPGPGTLNAENNWWGSANGPTHSSNKFNVGSQGQTVSDNVDFLPWWSTISGSAGSYSGTSFEPVTNTAGGKFASIQAGVDGTAPGGTVNVAAGTYSESVTINKAIDMQGANYNVNPNTGSRGAEAVISGSVTITSDGVNLDGFTVTNPDGNIGVYVNSVNSISLTNNILANIGTTPISGSAQAINIHTGDIDISDVTIRNNSISNVGNTGLLHAGSSGSSAKGIYVGDSTGSGDLSNLIIRGNNINSVYASTAAWIGGPSYGGGAGAYGILINHARPSAGGQTVNAQILDNTIGNLEGLWAHAIGLEGNTTGAIVTGNTISNLVDHKSPGDAVGVMVEDNPGAGTIAIHNNIFETTVYWGVVNVVSGTTVDATNNWWGSASGPGPVGPGTGANVSTYVLYDPWIGIEYKVFVPWTATTQGWTTPYVIANKGSSSAHVNINYYDQANGANVGTYLVDILPGASKFVFREWTPTAATTDGSAVVVSDQPITVMVDQFNNGQNKFGAYEVDQSGSSEVFLPYTATTGGWTTPYVIVNRGTSTATVSITYYDLAGSEAGSNSVDILPGASKFVFREWNTTTDGAAKLSSTQPISVLVDMFKNSENKFGAYIPASLADSMVFLPWTATTQGWTTPYKIVNRGTSPAVVTISYYNQSNGLIAGTDSVSINPNQVVTVLRESTTAIGSDGSAVLDSTEPISVIVQQFNNGEGKFEVYTPAMTASNTIVVPWTATTQGWTTPFVIVNKGAFLATVDINYYDQATGSNVGAYSDTILPGASKFVFREWVPTAAITDGSAVVTSNQPVTVIVDQFNNAQNKFGAYTPIG